MCIANPLKIANVNKVISCIQMESDEAGPTRRVARSRKRSASSLLDSSNIVSSAKKHHEKTQKHTMHSQAHDSFSFEEDWFINSFCSENHSSYPEKSNSHVSY